VSDSTPVEHGADREPGRFGLTRRKVLLLGVGGVGLAGVGLWGRFALGDEFERHVADQLGIDLAVGTEVLERMREEIDDYEVRAAGFLVATQGPVDGLIPEPVRRDAIDAFVGPMFGLDRGLVMPYVMAGLSESAQYRACEVLRRS
jgi:hypothetical protein